jgi:glutaminyl-tRNA synthetase
MSADEEVLTTHFAQFGLGEKPLKEALRNKKIATAWTEVFRDLKIPAGADDGKVGGLLSALVTSTKDVGGLDGRRAYVADRIVEGKLKSITQVEAAVKYIKAVKGGIDDEVFNKECGVGKAVFPPFLLDCFEADERGRD